MPMTMQCEQAEPGFGSDAARWRAVMQRDERAEGAFVYGVKTTGVYCRPGCPARRARRENVQFYATAGDAERAGFRPCQRCRPEAIGLARERAQAVTRACELIAAAEHAPDLQALADAVGMSPSHFHRTFKALTGVTPRAYAAALRGRRVRAGLSAGKSVTAAIYEAGYQSSGRFYTAAGHMLGMKPKAFGAGGAGTTLRFAVGECSLGAVLVAGSDAGICAILLGDDPEALTRDLRRRFARAQLIGGDEGFERWVAQVIAFVDRPALGLHLPLDVRGTAFQQRVWQALRAIPCGQTRSYSEIAEGLGEPKSARAVARACAANPVAVAIPCHRVVRRDGGLSGYRWGIARKAKLLENEGREK